MTALLGQQVGARRRVLDLGGRRRESAADPEVGLLDDDVFRAGDATVRRHSRCQGTREEGAAGSPLFLATAVTYSVSAAACSLLQLQLRVGSAQAHILPAGRSEGIPRGNVALKTVFVKMS